MSKRNMLGDVLAEAAGPLKDFAEKLGGEGGEEWLAAFKRFLRKEEPWPKFKVWKNIKIGTGFTADDFRNVLEDNGFNVSDWARDILGKAAFKTATKEVEVDLVKVTVAELGFKKGARYDQICERAKEFGLELCPSEVGPQLRMQYRDQPNGEWLLIGMEPITVSVGGLGLFDVGCGGSGLWLCGYWSGPGYIWRSAGQWVFVHPPSK